MKDIKGTDVDRYRMISWLLIDSTNMFICQDMNIFSVYPILFIRYHGNGASVTFGQSERKFTIFALTARNGNIFAEIVHNRLTDIKTKPHARFI